MVNSVMLVGRLVKDPEVVETDKGVKYSMITLAVNRQFKNAEGLYETDFINCTLWNMIASNVTLYCTKGDLIGVRGRVQTSIYEKDDEKVYSMQIIADKVTFLSSKKKESETIPDDKNSN